MNAKSTVVLALLAAAFAAATARAADNPKRIEESPFGTLRDGTANKLFTLRNHKGATLKVMTLGATIQEISMPDKDGKFANLVASSGDTFNQNFNIPAYTVGRVANRIAGASVPIDGKTYNLQRNEGQNTLHSGQSNYGNRMWEGQALPEKDHETSVEMTMKSPDGDGGFPGNLTLKVTFSLTDDNEVRLDYEGTTDKITLLAPTNHAYFNLGGGSGSVLDDEVWINADKYTPPVGGRGTIPTGEIVPVAGTPFDFSKPAKIGSRNNGAYDTNFVLNDWKPSDHPGGGANGIVLAARITDPNSGRVMEVKTDQPAIQFYTGQNNPKNATCFETQHFPDSAHHADFPSIVLKPGETFKTSTVYAFSVKK